MVYVVSKDGKPCDSTVVHKGQRAVIRSMFNKGRTLMLEGYEGHVSVDECRLLTRNVGIVYL